MQHKPEIKQIDTKELNTAIKKLKRKKSTGPDNIPNEAFIEADQETRTIYQATINKITKTETIPQEWQEGEIITMYKGKGIKCKCSNERGITLSSNFGKLYERIINKRAKNDIKITDAQAGGKRGSSTVDHLLILRELENIAAKQRKKTYMAFLDVTKAYDKAWSEAIMYVMHKEGIRYRHWNIIKKLYENITAKIKTKHGKTREIHIKDSIRQGGVLSVTEYGVLMDEINKDLEKKPLGIEIDDKGTRVPCLLWVDDVVLIATSNEELQEMLESTNHTTKKYTIEFGKPKNNKMKRARKNTGTLGNMELEVADKYKYLGQIINHKGNLMDHLKMVKGKTEAAYQRILSTAGSATFYDIEMEVIWKTISTNILPIVTYSGEVWKTTKKEREEINRIFDNILKRILKTPQSTPRECLYIETGFLDPIAIINRNRLNMHNRINHGENNTLKTILNRKEEDSWAMENKEYLQKLGIPAETMGKKPAKFKAECSKAIQEEFRAMIEKATEKSKVKHMMENKTGWGPGKRAKYMDKLTRNQVSTIFRARARMLEVKANYKKKYPDKTCRICHQEEETQDHVLQQCEKRDTPRTTREEIFSENTDTLRRAAEKIQAIMNLLTWGKVTNPHKKEKIE